MKPADIGEDRIRQTFNVGEGKEEKNELKKRGEDFAVQIRKKKKYVEYYF